MKRTAAAWLAAIAGLLVYEAYAVFNGTPGDTLSEAVWKYGQHPMVAFCVGILVGHFWWQRRPPEALLILLALPLLGAKGCSQDQQCATLAAAVEAACASDRGGPVAPPACQAAKAAWEAAGCAVPTPPPAPVPTPTPEPTPTPIPPPVNCLTHPACPAGQHCEQGVGCVADPLPPPEPPPAGSCPAVVAEGIATGRREMSAKHHVGRWYDTTPRVCGNVPLCEAVGRPTQYCCPLGPEGEGFREACETLFLGGPTPRWEGSPGITFDPGELAWLVNPFGTGRIRSCDRAGVTCSPWLDVAQ